MLHGKKKPMGMTLISVMTVIVLCVGCGTASPAINIPSSTFDEADIAANPGAVNAAADSVNTDSVEPPMKIRWGTNWYYDMMLVPINAKVVLWMNEKFNVTFDARMRNGQGQFDAANFPDIYPANGWNENSYALWAAGAIRSIPRSMIEEYAPGYAAVLDSQPFGWDIAKVPGQEDEYLGLNQYDTEMNAYAYIFSVYRLDWLENLGITPNGTLHEVSDRLYFSGQPFTQQQWLNIIRAFVNGDPTGTGNTGISGVLLSPYDLSQRFVSSLMGMYGVGFGNFNDGGAANMFYAGEPYKNFLRFLSQMREENLVTIAAEDEWVDSYIPDGKVGWWNENYSNFTSNINNGHLVAMEVLDVNPEAKLLVTPPEMGDSGLQGAYTSSSLPFSSPVHNYVIDANVSDEKLIKILQIFDALSSDAETWVTTAYGFAGEDFNWEGEPYASQAIRKSGVTVEEMIKMGIGVITPHNINGSAGKHVYDMGVNSLTDYAASQDARMILMPPYREDVTGVFAEEQFAVQEQYGENIHNTVTQFYLDVASGTTDVDSDWDAYLAKLNANGLPEWQALVNQYPIISE